MYCHVRWGMRVCACLCLVFSGQLIAGEAVTGVKRDATLSWTPPVENEDGSLLSDLICYLIYSGPSPQELVPVVAVPLMAGTSYTFENLRDGEHFFAVTALSLFGGESVLSELVSTQIN